VSVVLSREPDKTKPGGGSKPSSVLSQLPIVRLRLTVELHQALDWPANGGALLRSVFGRALRKAVCSTGLPRCDTCPLRPNCIYPMILETPPQPTQFAQRFTQVPNPYVIEPPAGPRVLRAGTYMSFGMVLIGQRILRELALILRAWQRALATGLGPRRVTGRLSAAHAIDATGEPCPVFGPVSSRPVAGILPALDLSTLAKTTAPAQQTCMVELELTSPLRLQHNSHPLRPEELTPRVFVSHLLRRINLLLDLHLGVRPAPFDASALVRLAERVEHDSSAVRWTELHRYSARQKRSVPQGGLVGCWRWHGEIAPLWDWLILGQWLHVGKGCTSGLGQYRAVVLDR